MISVFDFFLIAVLGIGLYFIGRKLGDYASGVLGGLILFLFGLYLFANPISGIIEWFNMVLASVLFGFGGYVWIVGSLEWIKTTSS